jgi:hypothetical protein
MKRLLTISLVLIIMALALSITPASADSPESKLIAGDGEAGDGFGQSVSISGDTALVGAAGDDDKGSMSGSAYVFRYDGTTCTWVEEQKLTAHDGNQYDCFGSSVSISGDTALVGAAWDDTQKGIDSGSAYVFRYNGTTWVEEQKLIAGDGAQSDFFGYSVSISGDTALVGAYGNDDKGSASGSAYVFRYDGTTWVQEKKLIAADGAQSDRFGCSVSISGDTALVGARDDDTQKGKDSGSAYVFSYNGTTWVEKKKLIAGDGEAGDSFGYSVSISGDTALIGAYFDDTQKGIDSGSAYVFRYNGTTWTWVKEQKLIAADGAPSDWFGYSVSISGDTALVGASDDDTQKGKDSGSAYVLEPLALLIAEIAEAYDNGYQDGLASCAETVADLEAQLATATENITLLEAQIEELEAQLATATANITLLEAQIVDLEAQIECMYTKDELEEAEEAAYSEGYQDGLEACPVLTDTTPPAGSVHAYANSLWPPNNKMVEVTISGYVRDEMSIASDEGGVNGVSEAHLVIDGGEPIGLDLDEDGTFSMTMEFEARKDAVYTIELHATDTNQNEGLVDQTYISVPSDMSGKKK